MHELKECYLLLYTFPQRNITELGSNARGNKTNPALSICEARMFCFQDMFIDLSEELIALNLNHKCVPRIGVDGNVDLGQDFVAGLLGDTGHLLNQIALGVTNTRP